MLLNAINRGWHDSARSYFSLTFAVNRVSVCSNPWPSLVMKVNVLWLVHCFVLHVARTEIPLPSSTSQPSLTKAVTDVINKSFLVDFPIINIITSPNADERIKLLMNEMSNEVARNVSSAASFRVSDLDSLPDVVEKRYYTVIFISDYETFPNFTRAVLSSDQFYFQGFYLVVMVEKFENQYEDMAKLFRHMWQCCLIINLNVLMPSSSDDEVEMYTFYPFTSAYCGKAFPILTNRFINSTFTRPSENYFDVGKLKNLFGCPLKVATFNIPPLIFVSNRSDGRHELSGIDGELLKGNIKSFCWDTFNDLTFQFCLSE